MDGESPVNDGCSTASTSIHSDPLLWGLRWRVMLGVLPPCPSPIDELRRAAADGRRKYVELRRRLIIDPHLMKDLEKPENLHVDNPLSQDPKSAWGRYFENSKIEGTINTDLARLYPEEHGSFFHSTASQAIMKRILLVWALTHPQYGYRQGMHELLAPLIYVLHMDVELLSRVRKRYKDPFEDQFDTLKDGSVPVASDAKRLLPIFASPSSTAVAAAFAPANGDSNWHSIDSLSQYLHAEDAAMLEPDDFGFSLQTLLRGSDSYGAEGELGVLLSARFLEHDAYCLYDALLKGKDSSLMMADFFLLGNEERSSGLSPVLEASASLYHTLSVVDMPLYIHLDGLGVEPQFFALRWFRVLFGREFELTKLITVWDAIFALPNAENGDSVDRSIKSSFISSFAVSMLLHLRPTLLATSDAASCLQKVLNFPKNVDVRELLENTKMLEQSLAHVSTGTINKKIKGSTQLFSPKKHTRHKSWSVTPPFQSHIPAANKALHAKSTDVRKSLPESYWEEQWINSVLPNAPDTIDVKNSQVETTNVDHNSCNDIIPNDKQSNPNNDDTRPVEKLVRHRLFASSGAGPNMVGSKTETDKERCISDEETSVSGGVDHCGTAAEDTDSMCLSSLGIGRLSIHDHADSLPGAVSSQNNSKDTALRTLGHSMVDSIKVLENALAQKANFGREGASSAFRETVDSFSKVFLNGKGHMPALSALKELQKISSILLQM